MNATHSLAVATAPQETERTSSRWALTGWIILAAAVSLAAGLNIYRAAHGEEDFQGTHAAYREFWQSRQLTPSLDRSLPTRQVLLAPLGLLPPVHAAAVWALLSVGAFLALPPLVGALSGVSPERQLAAWLAVAPCLLYSLVVGPNVLLLMFLVVLGLVLARRTGVPTGMLGGAALGLAGAIEPAAGVFVLVPLVFGRVKWFVPGALLGFAAPVVLCAALVGSQETQVGFGRWWTTIRAEYAPDRFLDSGRATLQYDNQALETTLGRTLHRVEPRPARTVCLANLPFRKVFILYAAVVAAAWLAWVVSIVPLRCAPGSLNWTALAGMAALLMLAISSVVWTQYFVWLAPALVYLHDKRRLLIVVGAVGLLALAVAYAQGLGVHMLLAMVVFFFVAVEAWRRRRPAAPPRGRPKASAPPRGKDLTPRGTEDAEEIKE